MKTVMIGNVIIKGIWVYALVVLVLNNHPGWACGCFLGALLGGYTLETKFKGE